jgi:hypothetical protein
VVLDIYQVPLTLLRAIPKKFTIMKILNLYKVATSVVFISASSFLLAGSAWAQQSQDPSDQVKIQNNSVCSFITGNNVNIRSAPGNHSQVITRINRGDGVRATQRKGKWVMITAKVFGYPPNESFKPLNGWVSNAYINGCSEDKFDMWRN